MVSKVGGTAADMAKNAGELGKPPRNRITLKARIRKEKCRFLFDVDGDSRQKMTEAAKTLHKKIERTRKKAEAASAPVETIEEVEETPGDATFTVNNGSEISGPFPLSELRSMLASGSIDSDALVRVEGWFPASLLSGSDEDVADDNYEVVEDEEETPAGATAAKPAPAKPAPAKPAAPKPAPPANDGDLLKVDAEFQLD